MHQAVLLQEALEGLALKADGKYIDATFGRGGHSRAILEKLGPEGQLLALDKDPEAIDAAQNPFFKQDKRFSIHQGSFAELAWIVKKQGWESAVDGILMDLGVSSPQLDNPERGFSFRHSGPLDMRMDPGRGISAAEWINEADEEVIAKVLWEYGEERFSRRIARKIIQYRALNPIQTTRVLAELIAEAIPRYERIKHPATRSFQAIRIFINDELNELQAALTQAVAVLNQGGRLCVISFHSLEDRIVKRFFHAQAKAEVHPRGLPIKNVSTQQVLRLIGKPVRASVAEVEQNVRARSAILRIAEKC